MVDRQTIKKIIPLCIAIAYIMGPVDTHSVAAVPVNKFLCTEIADLRLAKQPC